MNAAIEWPAEWDLEEVEPQVKHACHYCWGKGLIWSDCLNANTGLPCCHKHRFTDTRPSLPSHAWKLP